VCPTGRGRVFRQLSVLPGPFTLDGAEAVAGTSGPAAQAALARYAVGLAEQAAAAMRTSLGEPAAVRWLDAEDATLRRALDWALATPPTLPSGWWSPWVPGGTSGGLAGVLPLLQAAAAQAEAPSDQWCAVQYLVGPAGHISGDFTLARDAATAIIEAAADRAPWPLLADALASRAAALANLIAAGAALLGAAVVLLAARLRPARRAAAAPAA
jgi:hypothetical protein